MGLERVYIAGETERGRSQRLDAVWPGEPLGTPKAHPTNGAVCLEAQPSCIENNKHGACGGWRRVGDES